MQTGKKMHCYYILLFSSTSMYVLNSFSLLLTYWCVGISSLDHLFHDDFPMVFVPCFDSDFVEINFGLYFSNTKERIVHLGLLYSTVYCGVNCFFLGISYLTFSQTWISWLFRLVFLCLFWGCVQVSSIFSLSPQ